MQVHDLRSEGMDAGEIYDRTQYDDEIKSGDIIVGGGAVVILVDAWPVLVKGDRGGAFHMLKTGVTWEEFEGGKYATAYKTAMAIEL